MAAKAALVSGQKIGNYFIERELGIGGMGAVYRARHASLDRPAAVKVLLPQYSVNPEAVQRFFNEAKAATSIRHRGIVEIYDYGQTEDGMAYIAMELLEGESLGDRMQAGRLPLATTITLARQMCGALAAAHNRGIVHRDLKPDNIYVVSDDEVAGGERIKLLDFGIAKLMNDDGNASATKTGSLLGTPYYMAPEQCRGVKIDHRADLYSLGCIFYEMLAGRPPFEGEGIGDYLLKHMNEPHEPVDRVAPGVPAGLAEVIDLMLTKDPEQRVQSASDVIGMLDSIDLNQFRKAPSAIAPRTMPRAQTPTGAAPTDSLMLPSSPAQALTTVTTDPARKRSKLPLLIGVLAVAGAAAAGVAMFASSSTSTSTVATPIAAPTPDAASLVPTVAPDAAPVVVVAPPKSNEIRVRLAATPAARVFFGTKDLGETPFDRNFPKSDTEMVFTLRAPGHEEASITIAGDADYAQDVLLKKAKLSPGGKPPKAGGSETTSKPSGKNPDNKSVNPF